MIDSLHVERSIRIVPGGRIANQMFQLMTARSLARRLGGATIFGHCLHEWKMVSSLPVHDERGSQHDIVLRGHDFRFAQLQRELTSMASFRILLKGVGCRIEQFQDSRDELIRLFPDSHEPSSAPGTETELVVHVRGEDILNGEHRDYMPTPINLIRHIVEQHSLRPVFVGQMGNSWYCDALYDAFSDADFRTQGTAMGDFALLRRSSNVLISTSTYSWLATWLSTTAQQIFMPLLGFLNPLQRPDVDLLPLDDARYRHFLFPVLHWRGARQHCSRLKFLPISPRALEMIKATAQIRHRGQVTLTSLKRRLGARLGV